MEPHLGQYLNWERGCSIRLVISFLIFLFQIVLFTEFSSANVLNVVGITIVSGG